ncbi:MAG: flagellar basal body L-ring protein FlgH [Planctomycetes bacterium]|nr:flagellar basal body L-ring protein FlgH [Planctomycetota bacterium]
MNTTWKFLFTLLSSAILATASEAQVRRGSIYSLADGPVSPTASKLAFKVGDLVTIVVSETQDLKNEESSDIKKSSSVDWRIQNFDVKPNAFSTLPRLAAASDDEFNGAANYTKKGKFTTRLTATVVDVLPNGNLVLQGRREIKIDKETKCIEFGGIVRRFDLRGDNSVASELVANARVSYVGQGPLTNGTNRRGLGAVIHDAIDWVWPF